MADFMTHGKSVYEIGESIAWDEAYAFIAYLGNTPGTLIHMTLSEWAYPATREVLANYDILDVLVNQNRPANTPYKEVIKRPWDKTSEEPEIIVGTAVDYETAQDIYKI